MAPCGGCVRHRVGAHPIGQFREWYDCWRSICIGDMHGRMGLVQATQLKEVFPIGSTWENTTTATTTTITNNPETTTTTATTTTRTTATTTTTAATQRIAEVLLIPFSSVSLFCLLWKHFCLLSSLRQRIDAVKAEARKDPKHLMRLGWVWGFPVFNVVMSQFFYKINYHW